MEIPYIKLDETRKYVTNKKEMIDFIKFRMPLSILPNYKKALESQSKIDTYELKDIMDAIDTKERIFSNYNIVQNDFKKLEHFYRENLGYIKECFNICLSNGILSSEIEILLFNFLNYCISREEEGLQNDIDTQNVFNRVKYIYDDAYVTGRENVPSFFNKIHDIMTRKDNLINKIDEASNEFSDLSKTQVLSLSQLSNPGHPLTEEDEIDKTKIGGFIVTSIVLQSALVLGFILALVALFR